MKTKIIAYTTLLALSAGANAAISLFDFTNSWKGAKETNFATFAGNSSSVDTDLNTTTSDLSNSGHGTGGWLSYSLEHAAIFADSSGDEGMNVGSADQASATNYISFTVTPDDGFETTYTSLTVYSDTANLGDTYSIELRAIDGGGSEMSALGGIHSHKAGGGANNEAVHLVTFDFSDFASQNVTEWRIYGYGTTSANYGIRYDDITLNGTTVAVPEPSSAALLGLGGLALIMRRRK